MPVSVQGWVRGLEPLIIAVLFLLLSGCSAVKLTYNQGGTLAYWWLDRYADFSSEQSPKVRAALDDWFAWHRASELPEYQPALQHLQKLALADLTAEQVCSQVAQWQRRGERAFDRAVPQMAELVRQLEPAQIDHIQKRYQTVDKDAEKDHLQPDLAERREAAFKRTLERAEDMYGRLDDAQRKLLADGLIASPYDPERWLAERRARQQDILRDLRGWIGARADAATVQAGLRRIAQDALQSPRVDYRAYNQRLTEANCGLTAQLHNATTPAQRRKAADKLKGWENDVRLLIAGR